MKIHNLGPLWVTSLLWSNSISRWASLTGYIIQSSQWRSKVYFWSKWRTEIGPFRSWGRCPYLCFCIFGRFVDFDFLGPRWSCPCVYGIRLWISRSTPPTHVYLFPLLSHSVLGAHRPAREGSCAGPWVAVSTDPWRAHDQPWSC